MSGLRRRPLSRCTPRARVWHLPPDGFRGLRRSCLLSRKACADLLGCSLSAVRAWDRGAHRVPWSAVKLLRLLRLGDLGALRDEWRGWTLNRNGIVSPSGDVYDRGDLGWWSLTCRQAEAWRQERARQRTACREHEVANAAATQAGKRGRKLDGLRKVYGSGVMDLHLGGRVAFVSGSTAGIGFATARRLAAEGARVVVNGRTQARVDAAIHRITQDTSNHDVSGIVADLGSAAGVERTVQALPAVDVLVNNLGIFEPKAFAAITDADWLRMFETNVMSGVRLARAWLSGMRKANWGRIVFVSSESAVNIPAEMIHYGVTKTAQLAVARGLAETLAGTAVTVNSVLAGPTASEGVTRFVADLAQARGVDAATMEHEFFASARPSSLLKRFITPDEVANLIAYLASPLSAATNGAALRVDGGVVRAVL